MDLDVDVEAETNADSHRIQAGDGRAQGEEGAICIEEGTNLSHRKPFQTEVCGVPRSRREVSQALLPANLPRDVTYIGGVSRNMSQDEI